MKFSVLTSIYKNTDPTELQECFDSLLSQTVKASEYILVIDGMIPNILQEKVNKLQSDIAELIIVPLAENRGLGLALRAGMEHCTNELIARMDTDDIAEATRFEKQLACFDNDAALSIVGSNIAEFTGTTENIVSYRNVPQSHADICVFMKKRCPFNHMTVMFKKNEVEKAGGYLDWHYNEDSYLWVRMYLVGCKFYNIQQNLVFVRIDAETFRRRGGYRYYKSEKQLFKFMRKHKMIGACAYFKAKTIRFITYVLMPNRLREWTFKKFARDN